MPEAEAVAEDVQEYLGLGAFQSVYNWFSGRTLPSLDNMYALSALLGMRMEDLIVEKGHDGPRPDAMSGKRSKYAKERLMMYLAAERSGGLKKSRSRSVRGSAAG